MPDTTQTDLAKVLFDALAQHAQAQQPPREEPRRRTKDDPEKPRYVPPANAAKQLGRKESTLAAARCGYGPLADVLRWHKVAGKIMYAQRDLDRLIDGGVTSTRRKK